jgi:DNA polymerase I
MSWAVRESPEDAYYSKGITKCRGAGSSDEAPVMLYQWLRDPNTILVGANTAFDVIVACAAWRPLLQMFFDAYDSERKITDVQTREKLIRIGKGTFKFVPYKGTVLPSKYDLDSLSRKHRGVELDKDPDGWRLRYADLEPLPLEQWPQRAIDYAIEDSIATLEVYESQRRDSVRTLGEFFQARTDFEGAALTSAWGLRTSREGIDELLRVTNKDFEKTERFLLREGLVREEITRGERKVIRNTKIAAQRVYDACKAAGKEPILTDGGALKFKETGSLLPEYCSVSEDACLHAADPIMNRYAKYTTTKAVLTKDIPMLEKGLFQPISPRYSLLESLRRATSKPNTQNLRRVRGVREAFVPREGRWYIDADYPQEELYAHAESAMTLVGWSDLGKALLSGEDPHTSLAGSIEKVSYDEAKKGISWAKWEKQKDARYYDLLTEPDRAFAKRMDDARQFAKIANFGFMGGMGPTAFAKWAFASETKLVLDVEKDVRPLRYAWLNRWTEMGAIFEIAAREVSEKGYVELPDGTIRSNVSFTQWCNSQFQSRAALASAEAWCRIQRACYIDRDSPLFGCRTANFIHDQFLIEVEADYAIARPAAKEVERHMHEGAARWMPRFVPKPVVACLADCYSKKAVDVRDEHGELLVWTLPPWEPEAEDDEDDTFESEAE